VKILNKARRAGAGVKHSREPARTIVACHPAPPIYHAPACEPSKTPGCRASPILLWNTELALRLGSENTCRHQAAARAIRTRLSEETGADVTHRSSHVALELFPEGNPVTLAW